MRNIDRIKDLEKELGRYRKKVADQQKEIFGLRKQLVAAIEGSSEAHKAVDAILAQAALKYGERARDEETGEELGWRLEIPVFSVSDTIDRYEVRTRRDDTTQEYIVGVMERRINDGSADNET